MNDFNYDNEIIEIDSSSPEESVNVTPAFEEPKTEKKKKRSLIDRWKGIPKRKRVVIISTIIVILLIALTLLYLFVFKKEEEPKPEEAPVILEKDNYRYENGKLLFLDKSDRVIGEYECTNKDPDKCMTMKMDYSLDKFERVLSIYEDGTEIAKSSQIYLDNFVFVTDGKVSKLYDIKNTKELLRVTNIKTYGTEKSLVVINDEDNKVGLIEITEEGFNYLIRPSYDNLGIVNTKLVLLVALDKEKTYLIDSEGKKLSSNITGTIVSANDKYIVEKTTKAYNLLSYENEDMLSDCDYIGLNDDVISIVLKNRLYLRDKDLNKLNEEGIRLDNSDYVKKYVYDKENKLKETRKSYEIVSKDNNIMVTIGEEVKTINTLEGKVSSNYDYLSYYDGKLYFYEDPEKEDILGTYTCKNKNEITSADGVLDKCTILKTEEGYTGIYNDNIVVIFDNKNSDISYYVYSLKDKSVKGTYSYVDVINKNELKSTIDHIGTSVSYIISQATTGTNKGNYGVIEINSEKVKGKLPFEYKSISKEKDYYVFTNTSNKVCLYNDSLTKISNDFDYIKLYDNYYVGIINNFLNVYSYLSKNSILENGIEVKNNDFKYTFNNGFIIEVDGKEYKHDITGKLILPEPTSEPNTPDEPIDESTQDNSEEGGNNNEG